METPKLGFSRKINQISVIFKLYSMHVNKMIELLVQLKLIELEGLCTYMSDFTCFDLPISIFTNKKTY